jgi:DNA (cytosine-5)-methyltransferase 1
MLKAVDAFCGAGGLSLGLMKADFEIVYSFDNDKNCIETLKNNRKYFSHEVKQVGVEDLLNGVLLKNISMTRGELDLLAGGPPCQGFSIQRTVGSDIDSRNDLVHKYGDLILEVFPKVFLLENVASLGGKRGKVILSEFIQRMTESGYKCYQEVLNAQEYGVPQRRKRYIIIGTRNDLGGVFQWPKKSSKFVTVREVIGKLPPPPTDGKDHPHFPGHRADRLSSLNQQRLMAITAGQGRVDLPDHLLAECHRVSANTIGHRNVYGRMAWDEVAPTITARFDSFTRGQFGHPDQVRSISLYEGSLLQTFPVDFKFIGTKVQVASQIGNAVPPALGLALGKSIHSFLKRNPNV